MKKLILLALVFCGCSVHIPRESVAEIISGTDTITVEGNYLIDASKATATSGYNDTISGVLRIVFENK